MRAFQAELEAPWPLVAKPDVGQRGDGVHVVRDEAELEAAFGALSGRVLVQEFVPGPEFGVFWLREPGAERGRIFSVARKVLPSVTGDGRHTLEHLILHDRRTVPFASTFLARHADRLGVVPAAGPRSPCVGDRSGGNRVAGGSCSVEGLSGARSLCGS